MNDPSLAELLPRLFLSMGVVIIVMAIAARLLKNRTMPGSKGLRLASSNTKRSLLQVVARQGVGRQAAIAIVQAGDKALVVGITDNQITLLTELNQFDLTAEETKTQITPDAQRTGTLDESVANTDSSQAWTGLLEQIRERTVRR